MSLCWRINQFFFSLCRHRGPPACVCLFVTLLFAAEDKTCMSWIPLAETNAGYSHEMILKWKATECLFVYRQLQLCFPISWGQVCSSWCRASTAASLFLLVNSPSMLMASDFLGSKRMCVLNLMLGLTSLTCADAAHILGLSWPRACRLLAPCDSSRLCPKLYE